MNCQQAREFWHVRFDARTADPELVEHLAHCESCQAYDAHMRQIMRALDDLRVESEGAVTQGRLHRHGTWPRPRLPFRLPMRRKVFRAAAVLALMIVGGLYLGDLLRPPRRPASVFMASPKETETFSASLRLTGECAEKYVAVPVSTSRSDVQMFWLYPTLASVAENGGL